MAGAERQRSVAWPRRSDDPCHGEHPGLNLRVGPEEDAGRSRKRPQGRGRSRWRITRGHFFFRPLPTPAHGRAQPAGRSPPLEWCRPRSAARLPAVRCAPGPRAHPPPGRRPGGRRAGTSRAPRSDCAPPPRGTTQRTSTSGPRSSASAGLAYGYQVLSRTPPGLVRAMVSIAITAARPSLRDSSTSPGRPRTSIRASLMASLAIRGSSSSTASGAASELFPDAGGPPTSTNTLLERLEVRLLARLEELDRQFRLDRFVRRGRLGLRAPPPAWRVTPLAVLGERNRGAVPALAVGAPGGSSAAGSGRRLGRFRGLDLGGAPGSLPGFRLLVRRTFLSRGGNGLRWRLGLGGGRGRGGRPSRDPIGSAGGPSPRRTSSTAPSETFSFSSFAVGRT